MFSSSPPARIENIKREAQEQSDIIQEKLDQITHQTLPNSDELPSNQESDFRVEQILPWKLVLGTFNDPRHIENITIPLENSGMSVFTETDNGGTVLHIKLTGSISEAMQLKTTLDQELGTDTRIEKEN